MELIAQGAEAKIFKDGDKIIKERSVKSYRLPFIDNKLRKFRTRREAKLLQKLEEINLPAPIFLSSDDKEMKIEMSFIEGKKVRDIMSTNLAKEIGNKLGLLHKHDIIHADLTTSNMILSKEIYLIDFGLSFVSNKVEDKAVDLHLLDRALESKHHEIYEECMKLIIEGYKETYDNLEVLERLKVVEKRGRNKKKS